MDGERVPAEAPAGGEGFPTVASQVEARTRDGWRLNSSDEHLPAAVRRDDERAAAGALGFGADRADREVRRSA